MNRHPCAVSAALITLTMSLHAFGETLAEPVHVNASTAPVNYVTVGGGTTLFAKPRNASLMGPVGDVSPLIGYGRFLSEKLAVELDIGTTYLAGSFAGIALTPGVIWALDPNWYAAARFPTVVSPTFLFTALPSFGYSLPITERFIGSVEAGLAFPLGEATGDVGFALSLGVLWLF